MVTSRYSSCGQADRRSRRLAATAGAWRHRPPDGPPPGDGSLDVPLSVWTQTTPTSLLHGLIGDLTRTQALTAVIGVAGDEIPAGTGRRLMAFHDQHRISAVHDAVDADPLAKVDNVTRENLSCRLAAMPGQVELIIATDEWSRGEGFWTAATFALAIGGYAAIVVSTNNPRAHARVARCAAKAGLGYVQHIVAVTPANLDHALTVETTSEPGRRRERALRRAHLDVFVFLRAEGTDNAK